MHRNISKMMFTKRKGGTEIHLCNLVTRYLLSFMLVSHSCFLLHGYYEPGALPMLQRALVGSDLIVEQVKGRISLLVIKFSGNFLILGVFGDSRRYLITCPVFQGPETLWVTVQTQWWEQQIRKKTLSRDTWALERTCQA